MEEILNKHNLTEEEFNLLIGSNQGYYTKALKKLKETGKSTWNWPAFLFSPFWLVYRKMYGAGIGILAAITILSLIPGIGNIVNIAIYAVVGMSGTSWHLNSVLSKAEAIENNENKKDNLIGIGGTSFLAVIVVVVVRYFIVYAMV